MGKFFKSAKFRIILCIVALLIGIMLFAVTQKGYTLPETGVVGTILNPVRKVSNSISYQVERGLRVFTDKKAYQEENESLKKQVAALQNQLVDYDKTKQELEDLQGFLEIKQQHTEDQYSEPCDIIGYVTNDPFGSFYIDQGSKDGISLYDPVITAEGVVGIISEISDTYATVETLLSPDLSMGAISSDGKNTGIVEGQVDLSANQQCRMIYLDQDHTLKADDLIVTSNSSGLFPKGYLIGSVQFIAPMESGLSDYAVLQPAVDFSTLTTVVVVTDFEGKEQLNP